MKGKTWAHKHRSAAASTCFIKIVCSCTLLRCDPIRLSLVVILLCVGDH